MRPSKYFYDKPLPKYLDSKTVLIYPPHPVWGKLDFLFYQCTVHTVLELTCLSNSCLRSLSTSKAFLISSSLPAMALLSSIWTQNLPCFWSLHRSCLCLQYFCICRCSDQETKPMHFVSKSSECLMFLCHCRGHNTLYKKGLILQFPC